MGFSVFPAASSGVPVPSIQQTFNTTTNTISYPSGVNAVYALVVGGGGGGGAANNLQGNGSAGGAGGVSFGYTPVSAVAVVGTGGAGNSQNVNSNNQGAPGGVAGNLSSYSLLIANGGGAGGGCPSPGQVSLGSPFPPAVGAAGTPVRNTATINVTGFSGGSGAAGAAASNGTGGSVTLFY
jgi:hypothetical protein